MLSHSGLHLNKRGTTRLVKLQKTPFIEGYATIRKDRHDILGGGLLIFIRIDIVFEKFHSVENASMEILSIRLKATKSTWLELYNVYLPNTSTQHTLFNPSLIKPGPCHSFLGTSMATLKCGTLLNLKINVVTKFSNGSLTMICIFLMMALLLGLVESPVMKAPMTSPFVGATGQRKHLGD